MIRARRGMRRAQSAECGAARPHARHGRPALEIPYDRPYVAPAAGGPPALRAVLGRGAAVLGAMEFSERSPPFPASLAARSVPGCRALHSGRPAAVRHDRCRLLPEDDALGVHQAPWRRTWGREVEGGYGGIPIDPLRRRPEADGLAKAGTVQRHTARPPAAQAYRFGPHAHPGQGSPPRCADTPASPSLVSAAAAGVSTGRKDA